MFQLLFCQKNKEVTGLDEQLLTAFSLLGPDGGADLLPNMREDSSGTGRTNKTDSAERQKKA